MKAALLYRYVLISLSLLLHTFVHGQISVVENSDIIPIIQNLAGEGVTITNITYDCDYVENHSSWGAFTDAEELSGLKNGLILTTGAAKNAEPPNDEAGVSQGNSFNITPDQDLENMFGNPGSVQLYDLCKVEFDISVVSDQLSFDYIFASDEYPEYVGSFFDLFGFFISGPGIVDQNGDPDTINIALVPGTGDAVSVGTINSMTNSQYYVGNGNGTEPYSEIMQYDGFTRVLTAYAKVLPCETYHIKLAIADEKDNVFDSGILLQSESFRTSENKLTSKFEFEKFDYAIEGCNNAYIGFHRIGTDISSPMEITFDISGSAIKGIDYKSIANTVTIPAFQDSAEVEIIPLKDSLIENTEYIEIEIFNDCPALPPSYRIKVAIEDEFKYDPPNLDVCLGDSVQLNTNHSNKGYSITWVSKNGLSCTDCEYPWVQPGVDSYYSYELVDSESGCTNSDSQFVYIKELPQINFDFHNDSNYTNLDIFFRNLSNGADRFEWEFGDGGSSTESNPIYTYPSVTSGQPTSYEITLIGTNTSTGCKNMYSKEISFDAPFFLPNVITPNQDFSNDVFYITGIHDGIWSIKVFNRWGKQVYSTDNYLNNWIPENLPDGTYFYQLTNAIGDRKFKGHLQISR